MAKFRMSGLLRAYGVLDGSVQRLVRKHCEAGHAQEMIEALGEFMCEDGIAKHRIPANAGVKTTDLLQRTEAAMLRDVEAYHLAGGVLTAKGYCSITGLVAEMAKHWLRTFSAPIPTETSIKGTLKDEEIQDRLTLVALKLKQLVIETADTYDAEKKELMTSIVSFDEEKLEGLCRRAAITMFQVFNDPNPFNHEIIHGEKP